MGANYSTWKSASSVYSQTLYPPDPLHPPYPFLPQPIQPLYVTLMICDIAGPVKKSLKNQQVWLAAIIVSIMQATGLLYLWCKSYVVYRSETIAQVILWNYTSVFDCIYSYGYYFQCSDTYRSPVYAICYGLQRGHLKLLIRLQNICHLQAWLSQMIFCYINYTIC